MKPKYGTIAVLPNIDDDFTYVIETFRVNTFDYKLPITIPAFYFHLSRKTGKKRKKPEWDEYDAMQHLIGKTWNLKVMKSIINVVTDYLNYWKPEYLAIDAYQDEYSRRIAFYEKQLNRLGYTYLYREYYYENNYYSYRLFKRIVP